MFEGRDYLSNKLVVGVFCPTWPYLHNFTRTQPWLIFNLLPLQRSSRNKKRNPENEVGRHFACDTNLLRTMAAGPHTWPFTLQLGDHSMWLRGKRALSVSCYHRIASLTAGWNLSLQRGKVSEGRQRLSGACRIPALFRHPVSACLLPRAPFCC